MLKVTFAHIGTSYIPFRTVLEELGLEVVIPPAISQRTISLGTKLAPEFSCFPLKVNLGNYLEAIEAGADAIFMAGGVGPCRFGYYGELQREILIENGYNLEFLVLEAPKTHLGELLQKIRRYIPRHSLKDLSRAIHFAWVKAGALDRFEKTANLIRPREARLGSTARLQKEFYRRLDRAASVKETLKIREQALAELKSLPVKPVSDLLRVVMLGEIYMVLEPHVNFHLEQALGEMGVLVDRTIHLTDWVYEQLFLSIVKPGWRKKYHLMAEPYLKNFVGGHGVETVAHTVGAGVNQYDGVIELAPFTCMPEIIAMQVLPAVSKNLDIPVLSLIIDEHATEIGVRTRLEAFVDLLRYRRQKFAGQHRRLSGGASS
ncbi:MAG: acyl-CoA dehydratase activase-related protein [Firmicutes bacterium]|nr:acyl-CoA dehydratase activase-related protein [Bacillota bacterium]